MIRTFVFSRFAGFLLILVALLTAQNRSIAQSLDQSPAPSAATSPVNTPKEAEARVSGAGVIVHILIPGAEPVFRASGYDVRITPATQSQFKGGPNALSDIGANDWVRFEGTRAPSGEIIAAKADFVRLKPPKQKKNHPIPSQETVIPPGSLIDFDGSLKSDMVKRRMEDAGGACGTGWYPVPPNHLLQDRVRRIGMSVVPRYQRDMQADDPARIPFRFYAVDEKWIRSDLFCTDGLVLVPVQVVQRLSSDDELAAVLADGVAANLQRQEARMMWDMGWISAAEAAVYLTVRSGAGVGAGYVGGAIVTHEIERKMEQERGRVALGLVADAGYDPWQAPEAWRMLHPAQLPRNISKLKYPERSQYLQSVLELQFKRPAAPSPTARAADGTASQKAD